ncbi:DUF7573 domain-containing protein [Halogeometricum luteum]|uniref:DUF7573 domain-containing protein n=1 Tax=Halogeometricum luteum TaxID=2950537 RepID=A0ABU2FZR3_9EURY|nr:hypothetical protein [Halogeometricum sp. S3BR5-2]MDS0294020.1 hypothetical protein [Halogeometricum sp. S3BR5-2]
MTRDRSLDDFVGGGEGEESDGSDPTEGDDSKADSADRADGAGGDAGDDSGTTPDSAATESAAPTTDAVDPAVGTYRWDPDGVACAACGETVHRLWLDDGGQVCEECKEW